MTKTIYDSDIYIMVRGLFRYQAIRIWVVEKVRKNGHVKSVPKENAEVKD